MRTRGGRKINHSKRGNREKGERKADKAKGRQRDRKLCRDAKACR